MLRTAHRAAFAALLVATGCTMRLYEGPVRGAGEVAVIHVGTAVVREIDGQKRRGGAFDVSHFEVQPGTHRLTLVFELPARNVGMRTFPAQTGTGTCVLEFDAAAGRQYYLGSRARGEFAAPRWDGSWEGWVRDPSVGSADDLIARCVAQEIEPAAASPEPTPPAGARLPDHILVYDAQASAKLLGNAEAVDGRRVAPSTAASHRSVSDPLPMMVRVRVGSDDD